MARAATPLDPPADPLPDPLPLVSGAVALRRLVPADLAAFQAYRCDPVVGRYQGWTAQSDAQARAFLAEMSTCALLAPGAWTQIGIADARSRQLLGDIGLHHSADGVEVEIGVTLAPAAQGRGLATTAVRAAIELAWRHTLVQRVVGVTDARNLASIRLLERVGMARLSSRELSFRGEACVELVLALERGA